MSSRALRKAQREREEQEQLQKLQQEEDEDQSEDEDVSVVPVQKSAFAMLGEQEDDAREEEDEEEGEADEGGVEVPEESLRPAVPKATSNKKKKKKKKGKGKTGGGNPAAAVDDGNSDMDEIDRALQQLSTNADTSVSGETVAGNSAVTNETSKLFAIDTNHLHAQNEMRRLFGRAALEQHDDEQPPQQANIGGNRRQQRRVQQVGLAQALRGQGAQGGRSGGLAAMALRRNIFIQGKEEWPIATGGGLGMEVEEKHADGTWLYKFVHNRIYQDVQAQFDIAVESMDPNRLVVLLQHNPYHISTLLQVSEIAKQESDHATAGDLLERALFSFGRAVHSTFAKSLAEGKARLDFRRMENREFWLASWRYMQNLSMRATWRTVYEWTKLLLSLAPEEDPYAFWLVFDQYAIRARQELDFLNISRAPIFKDALKNMPNVQLSQGLAEFRAGNQSKGRQALYTAIGRFPWVVARLMQELQLDPPPAIWGKEPRSDREKLYSELYAMRAKDLWITPEASALLMEVASAVPPETQPAEVDATEIAINEARHVVLSETSAFTALIPRHFTARLLSASDPLPPEDSYPSYLADMQTSTRSAPRSQGTAAENLTELQGLHRFFSNLFPWFGANGEGVAGEDEGEPQHPSQEDVERRIRESGVDEETIIERTRRMMELQARLGGNARGLPAQPDGEDEAAPEDGSRQARVEDAADEED